MFLQLSMLLLCQTLLAESVKPNYDALNLDRVKNSFSDAIVLRGGKGIPSLEYVRGKSVAINNMNRWKPSDVFDTGRYTELSSQNGMGLYGSQEYTMCKDVDVVPSNDAPESLDWSNVLTPVKDQGFMCDADSFFAATGNVEAQYAMKYNKYVSLSEQQLLDCDLLSSGCWRLNVFLQYVYGKMVYQGGLLSEADYPYKGEKKTCAFDSSKIKVNVTGCIRYEVDEEEDLKGLLYKVGPLVVSVDAIEMLKYKGGIMTDCILTVDSYTGALLVGYGTENGVDYWKIKTSWGTSFGEKGFVKIARGRACCGIGASVYSAIVE